MNIRKIHTSFRGAFVYRNGLNYRNGLPEWTFICGFEYLYCISYGPRHLNNEAGDWSEV